MIGRTATLLLVDDEPDFVSGTARILENAGYDAITATSLAECRAILAEKFIDLLLLDERLGRESGTRFLEEMRKTHSGLLAVLVSGHLDLDLAVRAMRAGAIDLLNKRFTEVLLLQTIGRALAESQVTREARHHRWHAERDARFPEIVGTSPAMQQLMDVVRRVAATNSTVLIQGESGTGKELVARAIHAAGPRRAQPLISRNLAAMPATLVESILFGSRKGAFTDSKTDQPGLFEIASGSTLFLDEVGDAPMDVQVRLLRVLEQRTVVRLGDSTERRVDVRLITATISRPMSMPGDSAPIYTIGSTSCAFRSPPCANVSMTLNSSRLFFSRSKTMNRAGTSKASTAPLSTNSVNTAGRATSANCGTSSSPQSSTVRRMSYALPTCTWTLRRLFLRSTTLLTFRSAKPPPNLSSAISIASCSGRTAKRPKPLNWQGLIARFCTPTCGNSLERPPSRVNATMTFQPHHRGLAQPDRNAIRISLALLALANDPVVVLRLPLRAAGNTMNQLNSYLYYLHSVDPEFRSSWRARRNSCGPRIRAIERLHDSFRRSRSDLRTAHLGAAQLLLGVLDGLPDYDFLLIPRSIRWFQFAQSQRRISALYSHTSLLVRRVALEMGQFSFYGGLKDLPFVESLLMRSRAAGVLPDLWDLVRFRVFCQDIFSLRDGVFHFLKHFGKQIIRCRNYYARPRNGPSDPYRAVHLELQCDSEEFVEIQMLTANREAIGQIDHFPVRKRRFCGVDAYHAQWLRGISWATNLMDAQPLSSIKR